MVNQKKKYSDYYFCIKICLNTHLFVLFVLDLCFPVLLFMYVRVYLWKLENFAVIGNYEWREKDNVSDAKSQSWRKEKKN